MKKSILYIVPTKKNLEWRSVRELQVLCGAMNIPHTGTKAKLIKRVLTAWHVRTMLRDYTEPNELKQIFMGKQLKALCKSIHVYCGGTKRSMACSLLNWRNECRKKGLQYVEALRARRVIAEILIRGVWGPM